MAGEGLLPERLREVAEFPSRPHSPLAPSFSLLGLEKTEGKEEEGVISSRPSACLVRAAMAFPSLPLESLSSLSLPPGQER